MKKGDANTALRGIESALSNTSGKDLEYAARRDFWLFTASDWSNCKMNESDSLEEPYKDTIQVELIPLCGVNSEKPLCYLLELNGKYPSRKFLTLSTGVFVYIFFDIFRVEDSSGLRMG